MQESIASAETSRPVTAAPVQPQPSAEPANVAAETREPYILGYCEGTSGMPLELGAGASATLVEHAESQWLMMLGADGLLKVARLTHTEEPTIEEPCSIFKSQRWAAFDARTCDQTGQVIWAGVERSTGALYGSVDLGSGFTGESAQPFCLGQSGELDLPADSKRILSMQLADWSGQGRLSLLLTIDSERSGGPTLKVLDRKTDNFLEGFHPARLADAEADRLLARSQAARLLLVTWNGPAWAEWLHISGDAKLSLLSNFGGSLPPAAGRPRAVVSAKTNGPAGLETAASSVAWVKCGKNSPGKLVIISPAGRLSIADAVQRDQIGPFQTVRTQGSGELSFGPFAVATAVDWDNDGGMDLLVGTADGSLKLYTDRGRPGHPELSAPVRPESGGLPFVLPSTDRRRAADPPDDRPKYSCPTLADWTAHQRMDAVVTDIRGAVWYMRNNGGKTQPRLDFTDRVLCGGGPMFVAPRSQVAIGHWSGGAEPDLIGFDLEGDLAYWPRREKLNFEPPEKIRDVRERTIRLGGTGARAGLVHLWAGAWTKPGTVELIVSVPRFSISRVADWLEIPFEKELDEFPLFWLIMKTDKGGVVTRPLRTAAGALIHRQMPDPARSYSVCPVKLGDRREPDLLIVPEEGRAMIWPRESLRWD